MASENDVGPVKLCRVVGQAISIGKALRDFKDYYGMNHRDQVFLALLDNPRLSKSFIVKNVHFIYEKEKVVKKAKRCVLQREQVLAQLRRLPPYSLKEIKPLLRSHVGNFESNDCPQDVKLAVFKANLSRQDSMQKKLEVIQAMMKDYHFVDKANLRRLLECVQEEDPDLLSFL